MLPDQVAGDRCIARASLPEPACEAACAQVLLVLAAVAAVPIMLVPKPLILKKRAAKRAAQLESYGQVSSVRPFLKGLGFASCAWWAATLTALRLCSAYCTAGAACCMRTTVPAGVQVLGYCVELADVPTLCHPMLCPGPARSHGKP